MPSWHKDSPVPIDTLQAGRCSAGAHNPSLPGSTPGPAITHLFGQHGQPRLTRDQRELLRQTQRLLRNIDTAYVLLVDAVTDDDPARCATAVRSLMSIGLFLNAFVNEAA